MLVYVVASSDRVQAVCEALRARGYSAESSDGVMKRQMRTIARSDVMLVLDPGSGFEVGVAVGLGKRMYVVAAPSVDGLAGLPSVTVIQAGADAVASMLELFPVVA